MSAAVSLVDVPPLMTAEQFMSWPGDGTGRSFQLIDGEPVAMSPPSQLHGAIQIELARRLANHLDSLGTGCRVLGGPGVQPRAASKTNVRIPDLAVTCSPIADHYLPQPVAIIEILSPSNQRETYEAIRAYLSIPSLREIVVISSVRIAAEVLVRQEDGSWPADPSPIGAEDDLIIATFSFRHKLRALYPA